MLWACFSTMRGEREDRGECIPNDITPTAWKMPLLMVQSSSGKSPRDSCGTEKPCETTVMTMTSMLINASVLAFASYFFVSD